jgi:hypothetical protein
MLAHNGLVGGSSPPGPTTHSLTTGDFPKAFGILRFVGPISIPAVRSENLLRGGWREVGRNPAKVSSQKTLFPGQFSRLRGDQQAFSQNAFG